MGEKICHQVVKYKEGGNRRRGWGGDGRDAGRGRKTLARCERDWRGAGKAVELYTIDDEDRGQSLLEIARKLNLGCVAGTRGGRREVRQKECRRLTSEFPEMMEVVQIRNRRPTEASRVSDLVSIDCRRGCRMTGPALTFGTLLHLPQRGNLGEGASAEEEHDRSRDVVLG